MATPVVHVEVRGLDQTGLAAFYRDVFSWEWDTDLSVDGYSCHLGVLALEDLYHVADVELDATGTLRLVSIEVMCPSCGETERLSGSSYGQTIRILCEACGRIWERDPSPRCRSCGGDDLQEVVEAVVEKGRGTQLSVVGTRVVHLCRSCDRVVLERYNRNRPNPLMPDVLPTTSRDDD